MGRSAWLALVVVAAMSRAGLAEDGNAPRTIEVRQCLISVVDEAKVPAQEAGVLVELAVAEGTRISKGAVIARVNDDQPQLEKRRAQAEHDQALAKAESDVDVRFSVASEGVAEKTYIRAKNAFDARQAVVEVDVDRLKLEWDKTKLQIEQSELERRLAKLAADVKQAEVEAADVAIERRQIRSPLDGVVLDVLKHRGEWMQPGEVIARVVRTDQLLVKGHVPLREARQALVEGRPVTVTVELDGGREETFEGRVVFASPEVTGGEYLVHADVENRQVDGDWLLPAGLTATMTIRLDEPAEPPAAR